MTRTSEAAVVRKLATGAVALEPSEDVAERRERLVPDLSVAIERGAQQRPRARRWRKPVAGAIATAAAAAVVCITLALGWGGEDVAATAVVPQSAAAQIESVNGTVRVILREGERPTADGAPQVKAVHAERDSDALVRMGSGARVRVGPSTSLEVTQRALRDSTQREEIGLSSGKVDVTVPPLDAGGSFEVVTPDARVLVHGTRFSVEVGKRDGTQWTAVVVTEGEVSVHHDSSVALLSAGSTWTSVAGDEFEEEDNERGSEALRDPKPRQKQRRGGTSQSARTKSAPPASARPRSSLAAENLLFQSAMRSARQGDDAQTLALLNEFLAKFPQSPLAPNAVVERRRALARVDRAADHPRAPPSPPAPTNGGQ